MGLNTDSSGDTAWLARIASLRDSGYLSNAIREATRYCMSYPTGVAGLRLLGELHFRSGNRDAGFESSIASFDLDRTDHRFGLDCAFNLIRDGRRGDALRICGLLSEQNIIDPHLRDALGTALTFCEAPRLALLHFEYAASTLPDSAAFKFNLASVQRMLGATADAEGNLDAAIKIEPSNGRFHMARTALRRQSASSNHIRELETRLSGPRTADDGIYLGYALAKELEDIGLFRQSFAALSTASTSFRRSLDYDLPRELRYLDRLRVANYDSIDAPTDQSAGPKPIFVIGLPRSGTTLVERILTSVPGVETAGESKALSASIWHAMQRSKSSPRAPGDALEQMLASSEDIAKSFRSTLGRWNEAIAVVDKTPTNYLFTGFIQRALPDARIICLRRDPMDSCYAAFKTLFADGYQFSYDLEELGSYYVCWDRLISHWERLAKPQWLTLHYEDLIAAPERSMRSIVAHCGLTWNDRCLRFHESKAPVTSASAGQANRPLYSDSVGLWRNYAAELEPLRAKFQAAGILQPFSQSMADVGKGLSVK